MKSPTPILFGAGAILLLGIAASKRPSPAFKGFSTEWLSKMSWTPESSARIESGISQRLEKKPLNFDNFSETRFHIVREVVVDVFGEFSPRDAIWPQTIEDFDIDPESFVAVPRWVEENTVYGGSMYALWIRAQDVFDNIQSVSALLDPVREVG